MTELMIVIHKANAKNKFMNMRKRVYDVLNIFISLGILKKVHGVFHIQPRGAKGNLLVGPQSGKNGSILSAKKNKFLTKMEEMVSLPEEDSRRVQRQERERVENAQKVVRSATHLRAEQRKKEFFADSRA